MDAKGGRYGTALQGASFESHEAVVRLLLEEGADVDTQGGDYGSALQAAAAAGGHETIVRWLLLEKGANVNTQSGCFGSALQAAAVKGHDTILRLLLEKGADINIQGGVYGSALQVASFKGHEVIVCLLRRVQMCVQKAGTLAVRWRPGGGIGKWSPCDCRAP